MLRSSILHILLLPIFPTWNRTLGFALDDDKIFMHTSSGTHVDVPSHFFAKGDSIETIPLKQLIAPACVIDVSRKADAEYVISVQDVQNYEATYGMIERDCIVVGYSGWSHFWSDPVKYRNELRYPMFSEESITFLLSRNIAGIAIDCLSPEPIQDTSDYPIHQLLLQQGKFIIENLANAHLLPPKGAYILALPLKIAGSGEAPARVVGVMPSPLCQ